jgi:plasmid stabilization system protein ParE
MSPQFRLTESALGKIKGISEYLAKTYGFSQSERFIKKLNGPFHDVQHTLRPQS